MPAPYVDLMKANLLDKCPVSSLSQVRKTILREFGEPVEALFRYFEDNPIASASLA